MRATLCLSLCLSFLPGLAKAEEPAKTSRDPAALARKIDREIQKKLDEAKVPASPLADDVEFMRRAYLDITGRIPTQRKALEFLTSKAPDKRAKLIDELLASPAFGTHFGITWRNAIFKRDEENNILNGEPFSDWLAKNFNDNRGWDQIVNDMLTVEGSTATKPQTAYFLANRDMNQVSPAKVTGSTAAIFMGLKLECAECHNHPFVKKWKQTDFWSLAAFFSRVQATTAGKKAKKGPPTGDLVEIQASEKTKAGGVSKKGKVQPYRPLIGANIAIPSASEPGKTVGVAKARFLFGAEPELGEQGPYRPTFASWLTSKDNPYFAQASANRFWAHFFARGLVNPLDDFNDRNLPSHPELLQILAREFTEAGFDVKFLVKAICTSQAYQRSSRPLQENDKAGPELFSHQTVKVMTADMLYDCLLQAMSDREVAAEAQPKGSRKYGKRGGRQQFIAFFDTNPDGDATESGHGVPQFLRLMNSPQFNSGGAIVAQVAKRTDPAKALEELFLATLSRQPTPKEVEKFSAYVAKQPTARQGYAGVMWVLLNSAEFICIR